MSFYYKIVFVALITVVSSQHATICDEARLYTFIPDVRDCSAWFFCGEDGPVRGICPDQNLFNPETRLCDFPDNVDCFQCPRNVGLDKIPMNGSCRSFVRCINGNPFQNVCEDGLQFNENTGQCDLPDFVECTTGFRCPDELPIDGSVVAMRDNYNCSVYHLCIGGAEAVRQECNPELHFDSITNLCTFPHLTSCPINQHPGGPGLGPGGPEFETTIAPTTITTTTSTSTSTSSTTTEASTESPTEPPTTQSPTTEQPTTQLTTTEPPTTEPPTTQSPTTEPPTTQPPTTEPPTTEQPTTQPPPTEPPTTTPIPEFECPFDGVHPHPTECSEYFICAGMVPHLMRCADGLHFNSATLQCDFIENADCDLYSNFV